MPSTSQSHQPTCLGGPHRHDDRVREAGAEREHAQRLHARGEREGARGLRDDLAWCLFVLCFACGLFGVWYVRVGGSVWSLARGPTTHTHARLPTPPSDSTYHRAACVGCTPPPRSRAPAPGPSCLPCRGRRCRCCCCCYWPRCSSSGGRSSSAPRPSAGARACSTGRRAPFLLSGLPWLLLVVVIGYVRSTHPAPRRRLLLLLCCSLLLLAEVKAAARTRKGFGPAQYNPLWRLAPPVCLVLCVSSADDKSVCAGPPPSILGNAQADTQRRPNEEGSIARDPFATVRRLACLLACCRTPHAAARCGPRSIEASHRHSLSIGRIYHRI